MIGYICKYQNSWVYSNLFTYNLVKLIKKGVTLKPLFESEILLYKVVSNSWPSSHVNT